MRRRAEQSRVSKRGGGVHHRSLAGSLGHISGVILTSIPNQTSPFHPNIFFRTNHTLPRRC
jgi:hypothetical protein